MAVHDPEDTPTPTRVLLEKLDTASVGDFPVMDRQSHTMQLLLFNWRRVLTQLDHAEQQNSKLHSELDTLRDQKEELRVKLESMRGRLESMRVSIKTVPVQVLLGMLTGIATNLIFQDPKSVVGYLIVVVLLAILTLLFYQGWKHDAQKDTGENHPNR